MQIIMTEEYACAFTPYNPDFVQRVKGIGGACWTGEFWRVPEKAADAVREIMRDVYGYDDTMENHTVDLRLTFLEEVAECKAGVICFAKVLAHAFGRNSGARVGDDVAFIKGGADSGGSAKDWCSIVKEGSIAELYKVNRNVYDAWKPDPRIEVVIVRDNGITPEPDDREWQELMVKRLKDK